MARRLLSPAEIPMLGTSGTDQVDQTDQTNQTDQTDQTGWDTGNAQSPEMSALGVPLDQLKKAFGIMSLANPKSATTLNTILGMVTIKPPTAAEIKDKLAKQNADRIITQLENQYFQSRLHYGTGVKGTLAELTYPLSGTAIGNPNDPYAVWKNNLESMRPFLAKAAGDAGNVALQEQIQAGKPFPNARANKQTAIQRFSEIRQKFGLPKRSYDNIDSGGSYAPTGLQDIGKQFGGQ